MNKQEKIQMVVNFVAGRIPKSALGKGRVYWYHAVDVDGTLIGETFFKDCQEVSKSQFEKETANLGDAILFRETRTYEN